MLPFLGNKTNISASVVNNPDDFNLQDYRLDYPLDSRIDLMKLDFVHKATNTKESCSICPLAKHHKLPFPVS